MRIFLTGGTGFLGRYLVSRLRIDHRVFALSRSDPSDPIPGVEYVRGDIRELSPDILPSGIDVVVHLAALIDDPFGTQPPLVEFVKTNLLGTITLLEASSQAKVRRFVHGSTGGVVGRPSSSMSELTSANPTDHYGLSKYLAERALLDYNWDMEVTALRYAAPYARDGSNPMFSHLIRAIKRHEDIEVGADGGPFFQPVHVSDAIELTVRAMEVTNPPPIIDIVGPRSISKSELVDLLSDALNVTAQVVRSNFVLPSRLADIDLLEAILGPPTVPPEVGIPREFQEAP